MRKRPNCDYEKWNIFVVICDTNIPYQMSSDVSRYWTLKPFNFQSAGLWDLDRYFKRLRYDSRSNTALSAFNSLIYWSWTSKRNIYKKRSQHEHGEYKLNNFKCDSAWNICTYLHTTCWLIDCCTSSSEQFFSCIRD
jgi:hypothetical protein